MRRFILYLFLLLTPSGVLAQPALLTGTVTAEDGTLLADVNLALLDTPWGTVSASDGTFLFEGVAPGNYTLRASKIGYAPAEQPVTLTADRPAKVTLTLARRTVQLDEILAEAIQPRRAASARVVASFDLMTRPTRSAQDLLRMAPGLVTAQHAGGGKAEQIFLRGFDADHGTDVAISVDGVPVNMVSHGHGQGYADLHFLIPEVVEQVEVFKGPYSAEHGNFATAGAVTMRTRDHLAYNSLQAEVGAYDTYNLTTLFSVPMPSPHQGAYVAGQYQQSDGPFEEPQRFKRFNVFGKFHTHLAPGVSLAASVSGFSSAWDASGQVPLRAVSQGLIERFGAIDAQEGGTTSRQDLNVEYAATQGNRRFQLQAYASQYSFKLFSNFTFFLDDPVQGDMIEQTDRRSLAGLHGRYQFTSLLGSIVGTTTLGGSFRTDNAAVSLWKSPDRIRETSLVDADVLERNLALWAEELLVLNRFVSLTLGLRGDYFTFDVADHLEGTTTALPHASGYTQQAILSPKAGLVVSPTRNLDLFVNAGSGFHSNDARNAVIGSRISAITRRRTQAGDNDAQIAQALQAQGFDPAQRGVQTLPRAYGAELGFRVRPLRTLHVGAAAWWLDLEEEYVYVGDGGFTELSGPTRRYGLDLDARYAFNAWLAADADLNLSQGYFREEPEDADAIPLAPRITSTGGLTVRHPGGLDASLRYLYVGDRPANEDSSVEAAGYLLVHLVAGYQWQQVRLFTTLENLLDTEWNEAQFDTESRLPGETVPVSELHFTPGNPRNIRVGLRYQF